MKYIVTLLLIIPTMLFAQENYNKYVDFHIHTGFKHYYKDIKSVDDIMLYRNDTSYLKKYSEINWKKFAPKQTEKDSGKTSTIKNYNQSDYSNLTFTPGSILCTSLYPYEKQFALSGIKRRISNKAVSGIPMHRLREIGSSKSYPLKEFLAEYIFLTVQEYVDPYGKKFKTRLAKDNADLRLILSDPEATAQVISIEGGQVLYGPIAGRKDNVRNVMATDSVKKEILANIDTLRMLPHKVFFITPSHFTDNVIAGFSKTIDRPGKIRKLLKGFSKFPLFRKSFFTKFGEGIHGEIDKGKFRKCNCPELNIKNVSLPYSENPYPNNFGWEIYYKLLREDDENSKRILIDVKHMDIQARFEYYDLVNKLNKTSVKPIPIIAGHVAVSGEKLGIAMATGLNPLFDKYQEVENPLRFYTEQLQKYNAEWLCRTKNLDTPDRQKFFLDTTNVPNSFNPFSLQGFSSDVTGWFYPWSINLCDEEIKIIYDSDGIIGLNFDERILGGKMLNYSMAYFVLLNERFNMMINNSAISYQSYYKTEPLIRNILHIVKHSGKSGAAAWEHIAIGSDFDGLIDPIDLCATVEKIPDFHKQMVTCLDIFWQLHKNDNEYKDSDLFFGGEVTYQDAIRKIFYDNGRDFILKHF